MTLYESKLQTLFSVPSTTQRSFPFESPFQYLNTTSSSKGTIQSKSQQNLTNNIGFVYPVVSSSNEPLPPNNFSDSEFSTFLPLAFTEKTNFSEFDIFINSTVDVLSDANETIFNSTISTDTVNHNFTTLQVHSYTLDLWLFPIFLISFFFFLINILSLHIVLNDYNLSIRKHPTNSTIVSLSLSNILGLIFLGFVPVLPHTICTLQAFIETFYSSVCLLSLCLISLDRVAATRNVLYYNRKLKDNFIHSMLLVWILSALLSLVDVNLLGVEKVFLTTNSFVCLTNSHYFHLYKILPVLSISCSCIYLLVKAKQKSSTVGIRVMHEPYNTRYPIDNLFTLRKFRVPSKPQKDQVTLNYVLISSLYLAFHTPTLITFICKLSSHTNTYLNYTAILFEILSCSLTIVNFFIRPDFKRAFHAFLSQDY